MKQDVYFNKFDFIQVVPEACGLSSTDFSSSPFTSYIFNYVISGSGTYKVNDQTYEVKAGDLFISPPYLLTSQHCTSKETWEKYWVAFMLVNPTAAFPLDQMISSNVIPASQLLPVFRDIVEKNQDSPYRKYYVCAKLYDLFFYLKEHAALNQKETNHYVLLAKEYINAHYRERVLISDIANHLGLDRSYFSRLFYTWTQMTPKEYLQDVRLRHAASMVSNQQMSMNEIAVATGYKDVYNFSRAFKKKYHVSPNNYTPLNPQNL